MTDNTRAFRKRISSTGKLYLAGETLDFISHDISIQGLSITVTPGHYLQSIADFESAFAENPLVELFIKDLSLTGVAEILWLRTEQNDIVMGLEFKEIMYNADRLWRRRRFYRRPTKFYGQLHANAQNYEFKGENLSSDGMMVVISGQHPELNVGTALTVNADIITGQAMATLCWFKFDDINNQTILGLRYISSC